MNAPAAFSGTYADWKLIKTRGVVQIVIEVPLAASGAAYEVLGGMPNAAKEIWCAVALLKPEGGDPTAARTAQLDTAPRQETKTGGARSWDSMSAAQQAGILCADQAFQRFLAERAGLETIDGLETVIQVRRYCGVGSRSEIGIDPIAKSKWDRLVSEFRTWQQHPELVG